MSDGAQLYKTLAILGAVLMIGGPVLVLLYGFTIGRNVGAGKLSTIGGISSALGLALALIFGFLYLIS